MNKPIQPMNKQSKPVTLGAAVLVGAMSGPKLPPSQCD